VILDARIFTSKNGHDIDADREFAALGVSQIASAISEGFCVGSLDSGAALVDVAKGRTQLAGLLNRHHRGCNEPVHALLAASVASLCPKRGTRRHCAECSFGHDRHRLSAQPFPHVAPGVCCRSARLDRRDGLSNDHRKRAIEKIEF
jgi:hypothetical protein